MEAGLTNVGLHRRTCGPRRAGGWAAPTTSREVPISKAGGTLAAHPTTPAQVVPATSWLSGPGLFQSVLFVSFRQGSLTYSMLGFFVGPLFARNRFPSILEGIEPGRSSKDGEN